GALARKQLEVSGWTDTYLPNGAFDREWTSAQVRNMLLRARAEGFPRARLIGHGDWALDDPARLAAIVPDEARMTEGLSEFDDAVVCAYDRSKFDGSTIIDLIRGHPVVLLDGGLCESPLFVPAAQLMFRLRGRTVSVLRDRFLVALLVGARREAFDILLDE